MDMRPERRVQAMTNAVYDWMNRRVLRDYCHAGWE